MLVCPTSLGAIAGVDVATRAFIWGFQPKQTPASPVAGQSPCDGSAAIFGNRVLVQAQEVACSVRLGGWHSVLGTLSARPGIHRLHRRQPMPADLPSSVHRPSVERWRPAWNESPFVAIPAGGMPSGRGLQTASVTICPQPTQNWSRSRFKAGGLSDGATAQAWAISFPAVTICSPRMLPV